MIISCRKVVKSLLVVVVAISFSACGVTMSPVKRKPLRIDPFEAALAPTTQTILVRFESTLADKPLTETVWDNVSGAFWDVEESNQIGFTQNYSKFIPAVAAGGVLGGAIGGAVVGIAAGPQLVETRILIPFGRIFEGVFQSGLSKAFPNSSTCLNDQCELQTLRTDTPKYLVRIKVTEFQVWEQPTNHINLRAVAISEVYRPDNLSEPLYVCEGRQEITKQSIGSVMSTSSGVIAEMNKFSNRFAGALFTEIIGKLQRWLDN
jgi:hypothetical protein